MPALNQNGRPVKSRITHRFHQNTHSSGNVTIDDLLAITQVSPGTFSYESVVEFDLDNDGVFNETGDASITFTNMAFDDLPALADITDIANNILI